MGRPKLLHLSWRWKERNNTDGDREKDSKYTAERERRGWISWRTWIQTQTSGTQQCQSAERSQGGSRVQQRYLSQLSKLWRMYSCIWDAQGHTDVGNVTVICSVEQTWNLRYQTPVIHLILQVDYRRDNSNYPISRVIKNKQQRESYDEKMYN